MKKQDLESLGASESPEREALKELVEAGRAFANCAFAGVYDANDALIKAKHMPKLYRLEDALSRAEAVLKG